jgi:hypothetical protein
VIKPNPWNREFRAIGRAYSFVPSNSLDRKREETGLTKFVIEIAVLKLTSKKAAQIFRCGFPLACEEPIISMRGGVIALAHCLARLSIVTAPE